DGGVGGAAGGVGAAALVQVELSRLVVAAGGLELLGPGVVHVIHHALEERGELIGRLVVGAVGGGVLGRRGGGVRRGGSGRRLPADHREGGQGKQEEDGDALHGEQASRCYARDRGPRGRYRPSSSAVREPRAAVAAVLPFARRRRASRPARGAVRHPHL